MPYAQEVMGIYKIVNLSTGGAYVGQSQRCKKRLKEHFRLLRLGKHPNQHLQNSFKRYGELAFVGEVEIVCEDAADLDELENAFLSEQAFFDQPLLYNIAEFAKAPMRGKKHSEEAKQKIRETKQKNKKPVALETRKKVSSGLRHYRLSDPVHKEKVAQIVRKRNAGVTFVALAKEFGYTDPSSVWSLYHTYKHDEELLA